MRFCFSYEFRRPICVLLHTCIHKWLKASYMSLYVATVDAESVCRSLCTVPELDRLFRDSCLHCTALGLPVFYFGFCRVVSQISIPFWSSSYTSQLFYIWAFLCLWINWKCLRSRCRLYPMNTLVFVCYPCIYLSLIYSLHVCSSCVSFFLCFGRYNLPIFRFLFEFWLPAVKIGDYWEKLSTIQNLANHIA